MTRIARLGIVGGGAWGTTLGLVALRAGTAATVWAREPEVVTGITRDHRNPFLPGIDLDPRLSATAELGDLGAADAVLLAPPAQHLRAVCARLAPALKPGTPVVLCTKGFEEASGLLLSQVIAETLPRAVLAVLSGPTFAPEIARGLPAAVTLASADRAVGEALVAALGAPTFRPYLSADVTGAQVGGAVKNVLAIACGVVTGRKLGDNARAALVTRGLAEMLRLGRALGADRESLMGLSGLGDLVLTATSEQSRNMSLGVALGRGERIHDVLAARTSVAEGVATSAAVAKLAAKLGVDMPICVAVDAIVNRGAEIGAVIQSLLSRPFRPEGEQR